MANHLIRLVSMLCIALTAGCANLTAIQEFGRISSDSAGYTELTEEYATSPVRRKQYTLSSENEQRKILDRQAAQRVPQVERLMLYHKTVEEYMKAVANLAGDEAINFDEGINRLADAALQAKYIDGEKAGAVKTIASAIANALTDYYRQRKLDEVIAKANGPLQLVLGDMVTLVGAYEESLMIEKADVRKYYRTLESIARHKDKQTAYAEEIWRKGREQEFLLNARIKAAVEYVSVLDEIGKAHQELYDNRDNVGSDEVQRQLRWYSRKIYDAYKIVRGN